MMTDAALASPAARPIPAPTPLLPYDEPEAIARPASMWEGWQSDLRFFLTAYLAGFVFFLAVLS